jgi:hypothetical protein
MANENPNTPFGLLPLGRTLNGGIPEIMGMVKATADVIYPFDAVNQLADATIEADSATPGTTLYCGIALSYGAAAVANVVIPVIISPGIVFACRSNGTYAAADAGLVANLVLTAGDATALRSKHAINQSTDDVTATLDIKQLRLYPQVGNVVGDYAIVECLFHNHRYASAGVVGL